MHRLSLGLVLVAATVQSAAASDILPLGQPARNDDGRCAALGEGFFAVAGSTACVQISGHISAGANFGSGSVSRPYSNSHFAGPSANKFDGEMAVSGDLRFETPMGPGRVYIDVQKDTYPR
jgi:hypothetical protein